MRQKLIAYECVAPAHAPSLLYPDKLTIHERAWAFCPFDAHADGHSWRTTGGEDIDDVSRRSGLSTLHATIADAAEAKR